MKKRSENLSLNKISIAKLANLNTIVGGTTNGTLCNTNTCDSIGCTATVIHCPPNTITLYVNGCNTTGPDTNNATGIQCAPGGGGPIPGGGGNIETMAGSCNFCY